MARLRWVSITFALPLVYLALLYLATRPPTLPLQRIWHLQGLSGGAITTIGESGRLQVPKKAVTVDGRGKHLIPGLWDMHVHFRGGKT